MTTMPFSGVPRAIAAVALLAASCTSKPKPAKVTEQDKARAEERETKDTEAGKGTGRIGKQLDAACESLACTDPQRDAVEAMLVAARARRFGGGRRSPRRNHDANRALATAFASSAFSAEAIATYRSAPATEAAKPADRKLIETLVALHAALTPSQRATLAETVHADGLQGLTGARRKPTSKLRVADPAHKAARIAKRMCSELACSAPQVESIAKIVGALPEGESNPPAEVREAFATAIGGESLGAPAVEAFLDAEDRQTQARVDASDQAWLQMHAVLDPDQRKTLSETIAERGLQRIGTGRGRRRNVAGLRRP